MRIDSLRFTLSKSQMIEFLNSEDDFKEITEAIAEMVSESNEEQSDEQGE